MTRQNVKNSKHEILNPKQQRRKEFRFSNLTAKIRNKTGLGIQVWNVEFVWRSELKH